MYFNYYICHVIISPVALKKSKYPIFYAWLLLVLFVAGQVIVYSHQHKINNALSKGHAQTSHQIITEKCQLCDAMHFNTMVINTHSVVIPVAVSHYDYKTVTYTFVSLSLILSPGRAPPIS